MFFLKSKIRKLNAMLHGGKLPSDLKQVVDEIKKNSPEPAKPKFQKDLRAQLMLKHKLMVAENNLGKIQPDFVTQKDIDPKSNFFQPLINVFRGGWTAAVALLLIIVVSGLISYPLIPAPQVEGYSLKSSVRKIAYNAPIKIVFTQPMDRTSVEKAWSIEPQLEGDFSWSGNRLLFQPKQAFQIGDVFTVSLGKNAKSIFQKNLPYDYVENFEITGPPTVLISSPAPDSNDVPTDAQITVHFDRPMVSLTTLAAGENMAIPVQIQPATTGKFKWLGTDSIRFIPDKLMNATHYTITVPKNTVSLEGGKTDQDYIYSFDTLKPQFVSSIPENQSHNNGPETKIKLLFNQPMSQEKAHSAIHLWMFKKSSENKTSVPPSNLTAPFNPQLWEEIPFDSSFYTLEQYKIDNYYTESDTQEQIFPENTELQKTLILKPKKLLQDDSLFLVKIDKGFAANEGTLHLENEQSFSFQTVGELKVLSTNPTENEKDLKLSTLTFEFSQSVDLENLKQNIEIMPKSFDKDTKEEIKPDLQSDENGSSSIYLTYDFTPSTDYQIIIKAGTKDQFGKTLLKDFILHFKTAALEPDYQLISSTDINVVDASKPAILYVKTTNLDTLHFNLKKLSEEEFNAIYSEGYVYLYKKSIPTGPYISWDKKVAGKFNENELKKIDLAKESGKALLPGYYYLDVSTEKIKNKDNQIRVDRTVFMVTKTALSVKIGENKMLVWATSLQDGTPLKDMDISVKLKNPVAVLTEYEELREEKSEKNIPVNAPVLKGKTDKDGLITFDLPEQMKKVQNIFIEGTKGEDFTMAHSSWGEGIQADAFNIDYTNLTPKYYAYAYTDRPIYRPGNTVYFKGLVRIDRDATFHLPDLKKVHVKLTSNMGEKIFDQDVELNANGTFNGEVKIGDKAKTGSYFIELVIPNSEEYILQGGTRSFQVTEYRKPDYALTVEPDKKTYVNQDQAKIKIKAGYFFGAPLKEATLTWTLKNQDYFYFLGPDSKSEYASDWYSFSNEGYSCYFGCKGEDGVVATGKAKINENGEYELTLPLDISSKKMSQLYTLDVVVADLNNQGVSNSASFLVNQGEYYVGIMSRDDVSTAGKETSFKVITLDKDGNAVAGKKVEVSFLKRQWNTIKKKNVDSDFYYENSYDDTLVEKKTVTTNDKGYAEVAFIAKDGGTFKASAESKDAKGNLITASATAYVSSSTFVNWGRENNDRIELVPDKLEYKPGDVAHILVKSPYQKVHALVTYERNDIIDKKVITIDSNSQIIDVPITEKSIPNIFVSVLLVKGNNSNAGLNEPVNVKDPDERSVAAFKLGYTTLQVNTTSKKLEVAVTPDHQKYHPGDEVTLKVKTNDVNGKPVKAEISLSVVDKSVLSLAENVTADLLNEFYRKRSLGVATLETLTKALSRINVQVEAGLKGGGGSSLTKRGIFKDTAFWQADLSTDANGEGTVKFKLPDNLTTWQILATGITTDTLVGSQKVDFLVSKDVLVRPVLPRFLMVDDEMTAGVIVHNYLDKEMDFDVTVEAKGVILKSNKTERIHLNSREEKKIDFGLTVQNEKEATFTFKALAIQNPDIGDVLDVTLPIHSFSFPEVVATSSVLADDSKHVETVWLPNNIDPKLGELTLSMAPTLASSVTKGLQYLMSYPYDSSEQIASKLLPNVTIKQMLNLPGVGKKLQKSIDVDALKKNVESGLQSLYKSQQLNGGWGLFETSKPSPYITAYILLALHETQKAGYAVDQKIMTNATAYVTAILNKNDSANLKPPLGGISDSEIAIDNNARAFMLYVLAEMGKGNLGLSNNVYSNASLNIFAKTYLVMDFQLLISQEKLSGEALDAIKAKIDVLKKQILNGAKETPRGVHFEELQSDYAFFDTNTRTTALVLQMLSRIDSENPLAPKILRYLLSSRKDGHFDSTQETAVSLMALIEYLKTSKELDPDFEAILTINNQEKARETYTQDTLEDQQNIVIPLTDLLQNNQDNEITAVRSGKGKMYFDLNLKYYLPTQKIEARDEGITVHQEYFQVSDKKNENPVTTVKAGENLRGKITVIVPEDRHYVMVEDFLPAGLEGIDFSLKTSDQNLQNQTQAAQCSSWDCYDRNWYFNYSEIRDDRMMYFADFLPKGIYEIEYFVRATTPGTFHDLPTQALESYFPEVFGRSEGREFVVTDED